MLFDDPKLGVPLVFALGLALGILANVVHKDPLPWIAEAPKAVSLDELAARGEGDAAATDDSAAADFLGLPDSEFPVNVSLEKAKELYDTGGLLVLDAREEEEYRLGHIADAVLADYNLVAADADWLDATGAEPRPILVYCGGGDCELSMNLGFALSQAGHRHVLIFEEGYPAWKDAGYPTRMGDKP